MMRGRVASRHDAWRSTIYHIPRHVLATSAGIPLNHATSAVVLRLHAWRGSVHLPRHAWWGTSFENIFKNGLNLKYVLNLG
jgi:hypothetical protein